jgi:uncharacterized protein YjbI with pentapeptide repeats
MPGKFEDSLERMARYPHELIDGDYIEGALATDMSFENFSEEGLRILDSTFRNCSFDGAKFDRGHFSDVRFESCAAPDLSVIDAGFQDVFFGQSRLGGVQAYGTSWTRGGFEGCKVTYFNLRQAKLTGTRFTGCTIDELDLTSATLKNVVFEDCTIEHLVMTAASASKVDLRGARISRVTDIGGLKGTIMNAEQFLDLAPSFARLLGITLK